MCSDNKGKKIVPLTVLECIEINYKLYIKDLFGQVWATSKEIALKLMVFWQEIIVC